MQNLPPVIHKSWHEYLEPLFEDLKMGMIKDICSKVTFYPKSHDVFRVFSMPIDNIKVVILAQDPYIHANQAIGYALAVPETTPVPPSLKVISGEIRRSEAKQDPKGRRNLHHWVSQGVFLLNTALTVEEGKSNSHSDYWIWFTRQVMDIISTHHNSIWMLWGAKAQGFESYIYNRVLYKGFTENGYSNDGVGIHAINGNFILKAPHPVAETYNETNPKFTGCNHFNLCNEILKLKGEKEINW